MNNLSDPIHPPKSKPKKLLKKGEKAGPIEKVAVYDLLSRFELEPPLDFAPARRLFDLFKSLFLDKSVDEGLIGLENLAVSGEGTPVYVGARERKSAPVIVWKKGSVTANAIVSTISLTATSVGILTGIVTISGMLSTRSQPLIQNATFPSFRF